MSAALPPEGGPARRRPRTPSSRAPSGGTSSGGTSSGGAVEATSSKEHAGSGASKLFDLRILIGALFTLYGIVLIIAGFFTSAKELAKADGININLWLGLGMLILGLIFAAWSRLRPLDIGHASDADGAAPPVEHH